MFHAHPRTHTHTEKPYSLFNNSVVEYGAFNILRVLRDPTSRRRYIKTGSDAAGSSAVLFSTHKSGSLESPT
jgi:hypothetical protein